MVPMLRNLHAQGVIIQTYIHARGFIASDLCAHGVSLPKHIHTRTGSYRRDYDIWTRRFPKTGRVLRPGLSRFPYDVGVCG